MVQSKKHYLKTLKSEQDKSLNEYLALTYFNMAILHYEMGDINKTVEFSKKRLKAEIDFPLVMRAILHGHTLSWRILS